MITDTGMPIFRWRMKSMVMPLFSASPTPIRFAAEPMMVTLAQNEDIIEIVYQRMGVPGDIMLPTRATAGTLLMRLESTMVNSDTLAIPEDSGWMPQTSARKSMTPAPLTPAISTNSPKKNTRISQLTCLITYAVVFLPLKATV